MAISGRAIEKDGICGICPAGCFVRTTISDGKLTGIQPLPDHPFGMLCENGKKAPAIVHDPKRLQHPLRRKGGKDSRGSYDFERISWDDAFEIITRKLNEIKQTHGPEATAIYTGRGSFELSLCDIFQPAEAAISSASSVLFPFGSPNTLGVGALCYVSFAMIAPHVTFGEMYITLDFDVDQAELIVVWGANPATDSPPLMHEKILNAKKRGAEVIVIDPRRSETAKAAEAQWIPIRPGTDGALALGLLEVMIEEEIYDEDLVENWSLGWEDLTSYCQHFRPENVEAITGVPADTIRVLARKIASSRGAAPVMYTGLEYSDSGVQAIRAVFSLWAAAGQLDVPGGMVIRMRDHGFPVNKKGLLSNPNPKKALGRDRFPVYSSYRAESHAIALPDAVLHANPYRIHSLIVLGGSILTSWPNPEVFRKTLSALDFLVCIDRHLTADSAYADLVLPATTGFEIDSYMTYGPIFKLREKTIEPVGEARDDFHILGELAKRLGYGELFPQSDEQRLRHVLDGSGFSLEQVREAGGEVRRKTSMVQYKKWEKGLLRKDGKPGFETPSGKFEFASSILEEHGYDALPVYTEPGESPQSRPDLLDEFPLVFNSGARIFGDFRSQHHGVKALQKLAPKPLVSLNPEDAVLRGIAHGEKVEIKTPRGRVEYHANVTDDIMPGTIEANMGGGGPLGNENWKKCNVNELTDLHRYDPISGFPVYKCLLCNVIPKNKKNGKGSESGKRVASKAKPKTESPLPGMNGSSNPQRRVYLDHNATTAVRPGVLEALLPFLHDNCGNPSSIHIRGSQAKEAVEGARRKVAQALNCTARRIIFTGSGTEANNLAIKGMAHRFKHRGKHLLTSAIEHPAVLKTMHSLEADGFEITVLGVDETGRINHQAFAKALRPDTILASIMTANNETGTVQDIKKLAAIASAKDVIFHSDAVQAFGKIPVDVKELDVDLLTVSGHKIGAPKGIGALYMKKAMEPDPLIHGGGQERNMRSGTENVAGIVGLGKACEQAMQDLNAGKMESVSKLRDILQTGLEKLIPGSKRNGHSKHCLPNTLSMVLPEYRGESLVLFLDRMGVYFSSGSACKAGNSAPSHVLTAIGLSLEQAHCTIRLSLGIESTREEIEYCLKSFEKVLTENESSARFVSCR